MATTTGSVTIHGASGVSSGLTITNDSFGLGLASSFQSLTAQLASANSVNAFASGASFLAVENGPGTTIVTAPSGAVTVLGSDGNNLVYSAPLTGSSNTSVIVGGNGNDTVSTGAGFATVALGTGHNGIFVGQNGLVDSAGTDTVIGGVGSTTVNASGTGSFIASSDIPSSTLVVNDASGTDTTIFAVNATSVTGASVGPTIVDGYGPVTVNAGAGGTEYSQIGGNLLLNGSKGETDNIVATGGGPDTLYGASGAIINLSGSAADNVFVANDPTHTVGGAVDFNGASASGGNQFWAGSGNATLVGGSGTDTLVGGNGSSTMTGGKGAGNYFDLFSVNGGASTNLTVTDFGAASGNQLNLFGYGSQIPSIIDGQESHQIAINGVTSTVIDLTDGSKITLAGYNGGLNSSNVKGT